MKKIIYAFILVSFCFKLTAQNKIDPPSLGIDWNSNWFDTQHNTFISGWNYGSFQMNSTSEVEFI